MKLQRYLQQLSIFEEISTKLVYCSEKFDLRSDKEVDIDLLNSIQTVGLIEPLVVKPVQGKFELIAGHRRLRVCKRLGLAHVPCMVIDLPDREAYELALTENVQRRDLDPIEEANAFRRYVEDYGWGGVKELASRIGKSDVYVSHRISLLKLNTDLQELVRNGTLSVSHAKELFGIEEQSEQKKFAEQTISKKLTVRALRDEIHYYSQLTSSPQLGELEIASPEFARRVATIRDKRLRQLEKAILALKISLVRLDSLLGEDIDQEIRPLVFGKRYALHSIIDELIRYKMQLERGTPSPILST